MPRMRAAAIGLLLLGLLEAGCTASSPTHGTLTLATTTSTQDSGLLDVLVPLFREKTGIEVKVVAVGSGQALQLGRRGDADVILAHSPEDEERFMAEGFGESRRAVMHNDFVLVGPPSDPASIRGSTSISEAFRAIAEGRSPFVSRGDDSGTHRKELEVWREAGVEPAGNWYVRAGAGMGQVLRMADQERAYTLGDRATYLAQRGTLDLVIMSEGDPLLKNRYHVLVISPERHAGVHVSEARRFAQFLRSGEARRAISTFGIDRHGEPLFVADDSKDAR
jgi:tungstate transport system substrate-binding protein